MAGNRNRNNDLILGSFVGTGLLLLVIFVLLIGRERGLFEKMVTIHTQFPNVAGLSVGAQVLMGGVAIGHVSGIDFPSQSEASPKRNPNLVVNMRVARKMLPWMRQDSVARVDTKGLLGEKIINITLGTPTAPPVESEGWLSSEAPFEMSQAFTKAGEVLENVNGTLLSVRKAVDNFIGEKGDLALANTVKSLSGIMREVEKGGGLLHEIVYDKASGESYKHVMASLESSMKGIDSLIGELNHSEGKGSFFSNLQEASQDLKLIMENLRKGQGTLGKLLQDSSVYEDLKFILGRVQRNEALKTLVRFSISKNQSE